MARLLLLFTVVPIVELYLLLAIGRVLGLGPTLALVLVTGLLGAWLAKSEGLRVWSRWQRALAAGRMPEEGVLDGLLVLVGGVLLVTPGVLTDVVGLLFLLPPTRRIAAGAIRRYAERRVRQGHIHVETFNWGGSRDARRAPSARDRSSPYGDVIDAEGEEVGEPAERQDARLSDGGGRGA